MLPPPCPEGQGRWAASSNAPTRAAAVVVGGLKIYPGSDLQSFCLCVRTRGRVASFGL